MRFELLRKLRYAVLMAVVFVGTVQLLPSAWTNSLTGGKAHAAVVKKPISPARP